MGNFIRATTLGGYRELVRDLGGQPRPLLARFDIPRGVEDQDEAFISFDAYVRLLEASADELGCPEFGLRLAQSQGRKILGPVAVIARNSRTVFDGLQAIARYLYIHSPALTLRFVPQAEKSTLKFVFELAEPGPPDVVQAYEMSMAVAARIVRLLGGPGARLSAVSFLHAQQGPDEAYREALGCRARFRRSSCGFELSARLGARQIDGADPEAGRLAAKYLESKYLPPTAALSQRVAQLARQLLPTGQCSVDAIASQLAMHPRTLQRNLAAEGVRCQDVIDSERRKLAVKYLAKPGLQLGQIAGLLGYTEQSALNRSCRRWFGKTPRQCRIGSLV
ncbi:MAG: AraC family transcriptional regulator [Mycobacterium sp.]